MNSGRLALVLTALLAAGATAQAATSTQPADRHKDFEYDTLGNTFRVEWACFSGVCDWLDGPGREGMGRSIGGSSIQGCLRGVQSDRTGNLYMCDMQSGMLRALRKKDRRLLTLSGNGHVSAGRVPGDGGPAYELHLDSMVYIAVVGEPLENKGSVYLTSSGVVVRLFRNAGEGGLWWYERVAGGGDVPVDSAREYDAFKVKLGDCRVVAAEDGKVGVIRYWGRGSASGAGGSGLLFWIAGGKMKPAFDIAAVESACGGAFTCYGIDGAGNFVGLCGNSIVTVATDGKTVKHRIKSPLDACWGVYPDRKREWYFIKSMDHYNITRVKPDGSFGTLTLDGSWSRNTNYRAINNALWWMWGQPMQDGRYAGWNSHGCLPLFVGDWLEKE